MASNGLIAIIPVRVGLEDFLRQALNSFGTDIKGKRLTGGLRIEFAQTPSIHFARFALLPDIERGAGRERLLFSTDYDGAQLHHLQEILTQTTNPDAIWGCCEGYKNCLSFVQFIREHTVAPDTYYISFRDESVPRLRSCMALNETLQAWYTRANPSKVLGLLPAVLRFGNLVGKFGNILWFPFDVLIRGVFTAAECVVIGRRFGARNFLQAGKQINATLNRVWWIYPFNLLLNNKYRRVTSPYSQASTNPPSNPTPPGYPPEDAILQNQLTLITDVKPETLPRLRAVLALIDLYGRRLSTPGSLVGISTIHTVRWAIIDGGKRLLMVSNYDGTWENYIDEFAEMILSGLDALWSSAPDFPSAGAQDVAALKEFLRRHQIPANVFYSAYPEASVLNLKENLEFARWYGPLIRYLIGVSQCGRQQF